MFCPNCGTAVGGQFCPTCGTAVTCDAPTRTSSFDKGPAASASTNQLTAKKKDSFWKRLGNAIVLQAQYEAIRNAQQSNQNSVDRNPDGSWSYRNDISGNSVISDGENITFTK